MADLTTAGQRRIVRRRALANLVILLLEAARRTAGRVNAEPAGRDAVLLSYRDVRTLRYRNGVFDVAACDVSILLMCPDQWPCERAAALVPLIVAPADFRHPNSDGHRFCLDLEGVLPDRLVAVLYDNIRLHAFRLDHCVDATTADFVRAHIRLFPADRRPLYVEPDASPEGSPLAAALCDGEIAARPEGVARTEHGATLPILDVLVGVLGVTVPRISRPTFLRLAHSETAIIDHARATYLERANAVLQDCQARWIDGCGVVVDPAVVTSERMRFELRAVARAIGALGEERIARSYLALSESEPTSNPAIAALIQRSP